MMFIDKMHQSFFEEMIEEASARGDRYRQALFYVLGLTHETRRQIKSLYDFREGVIIFRGLDEPWQTSETKTLTRLAFNLFSGFSDCDCSDHSEEYHLYSPYFLFSTSFMEYCFEAVRIRNSRLVRQ